MLLKKFPRRQLKFGGVTLQSQPAPPAPGGRMKGKGKYRSFYSMVNLEVSHMDTICIFWVHIPLTGTWPCRAAAETGNVACSWAAFFQAQIRKFHYQKTGRMTTDGYLGVRATRRHSTTVPPSLFFPSRVLPYISFLN